jgi:drug/metabolite transporter (DMT)-like permease
MTRRGWVLFVAISVIWGVPYLLIKVAVEDLSPPTLVATRTALAFLILLPVAVHQRVLRPVLAHWRIVLVFAALEMGIPWLLLGHAEERLPSGLTGLLVATAPLFAAVVAVALGDRSVLRPSRVLGLALGVLGVALLVGAGESGSTDLLSVVEVLLVAVAYGTGPFIAAHRLDVLPTLGVVTFSLGAVALAYLPAGIALGPEEVPSASAIAAVVGLAVLCTAVAFLVFFALIDEIGPARSTLITFANPAVAVVLGIVVLGEEVTVGLVAGFPVVLVGCWLASRRDQSLSPAEPGPAPVTPG